ncbi:class A sortase [Bacillus cereus]|nr:class A sortase [Bacillus cereus]
MKKRGSQLNIEHFSVQEVQSHVSNGNFTNDISNIETPSITSVLTHINKVNETNVIGEIAIADVHLRLPILKGTNTQNLLVGTTTFTSTQIMGQKNYVLAGHHMRDEEMLFGPLLHVQKGTLIQLTDKQNLYTYQIVEKKTIHESETDILQDSHSPILTLFTCDVAGATDKRFVVQAALLRTESLKDESKYVKHYKQQIRTETSKDEKYVTFLTASAGLCGLVLLFVRFLSHERRKSKSPVGGKPN